VGDLRIFMLCFSLFGSYTPCYIVQGKTLLRESKAISITLYPFSSVGHRCYKRMYERVYLFLKTHIFPPQFEKGQFKCRDVGGNLLKHATALLCPYHYNSTVSKNK